MKNEMNDEQNLKDAKRVEGGGGHERKRGEVEGEERRRTIEFERKYNFQEKHGEQIRRSRMKVVPWGFTMQAV